VTSLASAWVIQNRHDRAEHLERDKISRQELYRKFIDEASKLYADALVRSEAEVGALVSIYALISQMRVVSSPAVIDEAERVARVIVETYAAQNKTFMELRQAMVAHPTSLLRIFSEKCREELSEVQSPLSLALGRP
jgi:ribosomal protein S17